MSRIGAIPPPADPWAGPYPATLPLLEPLPPPRRRRSRAPLFIAVAVVTALLAGAAAYVGATVWYGWGATEPEHVLPASVAGFARLDLSPGLGQGIRLNAIAGKFPRQAGADVAERLKREAVATLGLEPLDYDTDIRPWLGGRLGLAAWAPAGSPGGLCRLTAMESKDDAAASTALEKVRTAKGAQRFGFGFEAGYAVLAACASGSQAAATAAIAAPALADRAEFGLSQLPSGQFGVAWADLSQADRAASILPASMLRGADGPTFAGVTGFLVGGVQATGSGLEVRWRLTGAAAPPPTRDVLADLGSLPGGTAIGVSADLSGLTGPHPGLAFLGRLDARVAALLGSVVGVSVTDASANPALRLVAQAPNAEKARAIASLFTLSWLAGASVQTAGSTVTITSRDYRAGEGTLADASLFRAATAGAPGRIVAAGYVDVGRATAGARLTATEAANLAPIKAVAATIGFEDGAIVGMARVVIP